MTCLFYPDMTTSGGIIDTSTKNYSFLRMVGVLERMGIKNRYFFLHLTQPDLKGYDPHNLTDPSQELRMRIAYEIKVNPWYYLREVVRVPAAGGDPIRYILNRANLAMCWVFFTSTHLFLVMPRQMGKTTGTACLYSWLIYFAYKNTTLGLFAKDSDLVHENVAQIKTIRRGLPQWLLNLTPQDTDNKEGLSYDKMNNVYKTFIAKPEIVAAKRQGRGERLATEHYDEFAFYKNNHLSYPAATSASDKAQIQVQEIGLPACNIITTTAGRLSEPSGAYAYGIKQNCVRFTEKFYDAEDKEAFKKIVDANSCNHMVYLEYSYKQLGYDDAWLKSKIADKTQEQVEMDYLNIWQQGTGSSIVPAELLLKITEGESEPVEFSNSGALIVRWYVAKDVLLSDKNKNKNYIIGLDTSDNVGRDFTTMVIADPTDLTIVATCKCNVANFIHVVNCVADMLDMLPKSILIPERNKNGAVLIDILIELLMKKGENPFYRIYNTYIQDYCEKTPDLTSIDLSDGTHRKHFGFNTSSSSDSRDALYGRVLINMLNHMASRVFDKDLASEIKSLTVRNGRVDHPIGSHDDMCIAMLLCGYFAFFGKNHHMYGIPTGDILKNVGANGNLIDTGAKDRQLQIRARIGELKAKLITTTNDMLVASYTRELKALEAEVDTSIINEETINVDQLRYADITRKTPSTLDFNSLRTLIF